MTATVADLIARLQEFPQDAYVSIASIPAGDLVDLDLSDDSSDIRFTPDDDTGLYPALDIGRVNQLP